MTPKSKVELFATIRRDSRTECLSVRVVVSREADAFNGKPTIGCNRIEMESVIGARVAVSALRLGTALAETELLCAAFIVEADAALATNADSAVPSVTAAVAAYSRIFMPSPVCSCSVRGRSHYVLRPMLGRSAPDYGIGALSCVDAWLSVGTPRNTVRT